MDRENEDVACLSYLKPNTYSLSPAPSFTTQESDTLNATPYAPELNKPFTDDDLLEQARDAHTSIDFESLASRLDNHEEWKHVEAADGFAVFQRLVCDDDSKHNLEVMCVGRIKASLEELASILHSTSEAEHNTIMSGLYAKSFIFGSFEREVGCTENQKDEDEDALLTNDEQLVVKADSFARTSIWGRNEQWCFFDYFQRKKERDGFTILKRALPPSMKTPGRIEGENYRVDQLHGLNASYLVDLNPDGKGLRVVFNAWFEMAEKEVQEYYAGKRTVPRRKSQETSHSKFKFKPLFKSFDFQATTSYKAQVYRLLAMARGMMQLPTLVRRRRFGVQVPIDFNAVQIANKRCPCCTHRLGPVKTSLAAAASVISTRSLGSLRSNTKRCYLCGYLVCVECWRAETMECAAGRVAAIVVCTRCRANVHACDYSEVFAGTAAQQKQHRGPARVVQDPTNAPTVSLLIDFLSTSLANSAANSSDHAAVVAVIRTLLRQNFGEIDDDSEDASDDNDNNQCDGHEARSQILGELRKVDEVLSDESRLPTLEACKLGNARERNYVLELPDDPSNNVPLSPFPSNEADRIASASAVGLLQLAERLAPREKAAVMEGGNPDTQDLELLCRLAVTTMNCSYSFVTIMGENHEHVLASTHSGFTSAAVPREQTTCQHALMSPHPFMVAHHEADVRFQNHWPTSSIPTRFYVGFPVTVPLANGQPGDPEVTAGTLCCVDVKPRAEITRTQYATMKQLAKTAQTFLMQKGHLLLEQNGLGQNFGVVS